MGNNASNLAAIDSAHLGTWNKLMQVSNPSLRVQTIETLFQQRPDYITSAKRAGVYNYLIQYCNDVRRGLPPPQNHGMYIGPIQFQAPAVENHRTIMQAPPPGYQDRLPPPSSGNAIMTYGGGNEVSGRGPQDPYTVLQKPKRSEKALSFFNACLKVLAIEEEVALTEDSLKRAYKKAAIKVHPDKGGTEAEFDAVTRAYAYLTEILRITQGRKARDDKAPPVSMNEANQLRERESEAWSMKQEPVRLNPKNLDMNVFNQMFEQNRMPDPDDDGYGDWLKEQDEERGKTQKFSGKFNRDVFNKMFEGEVRSRGGDNQQQLSVYSPQSLALANVGVELGRGRTDDHTAPYNANLKYTDLKTAYVKENVITPQVSNIRVEERSMKTYGEAYKRGPETYSSEEQAYMERLKSMEEDKERQRRVRMAQEQMDVQDHFQRMKRLVIADK